MPDISEKTKCYTYRVELVVQVLAKDLPSAANTLNAVGGHTTSRKVELLGTTELMLEPKIKEEKEKPKNIFD